jgi:hypothetical protein
MMTALIIAILAAVLSAAGFAWAPSDPVPAVPGHIVASDALYTFITPEWECSPQAPEGCAQYALVALQARLPGLTWAGLAAIITQTEFGTVWADDTRATIAELVWRRLFDAQSGGLRWDGTRYAYDQSNLLQFGGSWQGLTDSVLITEGYAVVNVRRLLGVVPGCEAVYCRGYTRFTAYLAQYASEHLPTLRTGLGPRVPSASGLFCVPTGQSLTETYFARRVVGTCVGGDVVWYIVPTTARFKVMGR